MYEIKENTKFRALNDNVDYNEYSTYIFIYVYI